MKAKTITLNDSNTIPQIGLGVWQARDGDETKAVKHALSVGYRHIDTAAIYRNEEGVGQGMKDSGVPRSEIFLTSKIWNDEIRQGTTHAALDASLDRLGTDYLDLILLHWPAEGRVEAWKELIEARETGKVRSIGVSNFLPEHLDELVAETDVVPAINQIEHHPWLTQPAIRKSCEKHGIVVEAWSPLMQGRFAEEPALASLAESHGRSPAQIVLRWALQNDIVIIPKSVTPERIEENFQLFDFQLPEADMATLDALDKNQRLGPDPASFDF